MRRAAVVTEDRRQELEGLLTVAQARKRAARERVDRYGTEAAYIALGKACADIKAISGELRRAKGAR